MENIFPFAESRTENLDVMIATYGGLLFLGIFLGLVFIFATVLIIYYKQVSEGYEDRERFATMRNDGKGNKEKHKLAGADRVLRSSYLCRDTPCIRFSDNT